MDLDFGLDYLCWDNVSEVRLQSRRGAAGPVAGVLAKRRQLTGKELADSGGVYAGDDLVWLVPAAVLPPGFTPKPADVVIDGDGTRYTALGVDLLKNRCTWKLTTRDLVLAHDLRDTVNIERAAITYDPAGVAVKAFPTGPPGQRIGGTVLYADLPARVQPLTDEVRDERGIRGFVGSHAIIVAEEVSVTNEDRVLFNGRYYDIVGYHNAQRIDELPVLDCELRP